MLEAHAVLYKIKFWGLITYLGKGIGTLHEEHPHSLNKTKISEGIQKEFNGICHHHYAQHKLTTALYTKKIVFLKKILWAFLGVKLGKFFTDSGERLEEILKVG
jgi:hypothetical protein